MLEYSPTGTNVRTPLKSRDAEHEKALQYAEDLYAKGYLQYVEYNLADDNMARIEEYWSMARRSAFLVAEDKKTGEVVGTVAIQPVSLCGEGDWYCRILTDHCAQIPEDGSNPVDAAAKQFNLLPSALYCADDPAYDPATYVPRDTVVLPADGSEVDDERVYLQPGPQPCALDAAAQSPRRVPAGYFRRFQPRGDFGLPLPMPADAYTAFASRAHEQHAPIAEEMASGTYTYLTSFGAAADLPRASTPSEGYMEAELRRMSVTRAHRGNGAAQLLLFTALQTARQVFGFEALHLSTAQTMDMAMKFYRRMGFREVHHALEGVDMPVPWRIARFKYCLTERGVAMDPLRYHHASAVWE
jgi:GNAT superfamily N-acetyltransferase